MSDGERGRIKLLDSAGEFVTTAVAVALHQKNNKEKHETVRSLFRKSKKNARTLVHADAAVSAAEARGAWAAAAPDP